MDEVRKVSDLGSFGGRAPLVLVIAMGGGRALQVLQADNSFGVRVAGSWQECRQELARIRPDSIVVELSAPALTDVAELRMLRAAYRAPVLLVSEPVDEERVTGLIKAGASGYLLNHDLSRLPDAVRELLRGGVPMSRSVSQLVLSRARRSSAKMAAVRAGSPAVEELVTPRQREILKLLANGHSYDDIGLALDLSVNTVRSHIRAIYERLGASTKVEAVIAAMELGLLDRNVTR
jgi:DNA-binding NarL/FixJ family response regulator